MSQHNSLRGSAATSAKRSVLKRFERVAVPRSAVNGNQATGSLVFARPSPKVDPHLAALFLALLPHPSTLSALPMESVRLQKYLAEAGLGSRRACEDIILAGRVSVNGEIHRRLGTKVHPHHDRIRVDDQPIRPQRRRYLALHKPFGYICSRKRQSPRSKLVEELLPSQWRHLFCVGRLDAQSEGLIFLTNDGDFSNRLIHPRYGIRKIYEVAVQGPAPASLISDLRRGVQDQGEHLQVAAAKVLASNNTRSILELTLTEGKNREIRRLLGAFGLPVNRLLRVQIGPVKLGELPKGKWRTLTESEIKSLLPTL